MIENEIELEITKEALNQFSSALNNLESDDYFQNLSSKKQEIYKKSIVGEIEVLEEQIHQYKELKDFYSKKEKA